MTPNRSMMKFILGKKLNMTQIFKEDGEVVPATIIKAGPCLVTQIKTKEKDGYEAVQIGFGTKKSKVKKPVLSEAKDQKSKVGQITNKACESNFKHLREFKCQMLKVKCQMSNVKGQMSNVKGQEFPLSKGGQGVVSPSNVEGQMSNVKGQMSVGDKIDVSIFQSGDKIQVSGISKGKGFQGVVKRWGFRGGPASHGHKDQLRAPGSIGSTDAQRVFKGKKMAGRMGGDRITVKGLEVVEVDKEKGLLMVKGAVPGGRNGLVEIRGN